MSPATDLAAFIAGFVAAEGTFGFVRPRRFRFAVSLGARDASTCELLRDYFGAGTVRTYDRRLAHYDDEVVFQIRAFRDLVEVVVPFMDEHLPPCHKRDQYLVWRAQLLEYVDQHARPWQPRPNR